MKITVRALRKIIRECLSESATDWRIRDALGPEISDREQLARNTSKGTKNDDNEDIAPHLVEPQESPEDCYGPVPPSSDPVHALIDPYTKGTNILPSPAIMR